MDEVIVALLHGTCVGDVDGLTQGAFDAQGLVHGTIDEGKVALLHGTCVGKVYGLT